MATSIDADRINHEAVALVDISKRFGSVVANDSVTFVAHAGEVHALIGENGAGKSTLMSILAGMYRPDSGILRIGGQVADLRSPADAIALGVGMVYQHFMLIESFTIAENVMLGLPAAGVRLDTAHVEAELRRLSDAYGLGIDPSAYIWQLSVGEQQRVEIMRLLYRGARILVLDEPTAVLTPQEADSLIATLRQMASQGFCIIFISHKLNEVLAVADRITVLRQSAVVDTVDAASASRQDVARMMVGRELASVLLEDDGLTAHRTGHVVLAIRDLTASNEKRLPALRGVSLEVRAGETLGIAGVAGNGQRELAEVITGLRPAVSGSVLLDGREITNQQPRAIARAGVAHVPEDRLGTGLVGSLDVSSNAILRAYRHRPIAKGSFLASRAIARFTDGLIGSYDIKTAGRWARLQDLSGGNQQKLLIARELAGEPKVIVAVHPTRGVDVGASEAIHDVLRTQRLRGAATLLISEDLGELLALSDRIAVLYEGRVMGTVAARDADPETLGMMMAGASAAQIAAARDTAA
ncbi:MAG: ABC transporter ATP-binding protein [Chloroflexota bacterium]|nr:ABC transporter ATP-binding protein [Chloroflexota bacterium]